MKRARVVWLAALVMAAEACAAIGGLGDFSFDAGADTAADAASDASPPEDGAVVGDGSSPADSGSDATANLLANASFEEGAGGCGTGWAPNAAWLARSTPARGGAAACLLCVTPPDSTYFSVDATIAVPVPAAGSYYAEAWLRAPDDASVAGLTGVQVWFSPADGGSSIVFQANEVSPTAAWTASSIGFVVDGPGSLSILVHCYQPNAGCILIDDVGLYRQ
jgi:hypothetical protein